MISLSLSHPFPTKSANTRFGNTYVLPNCTSLSSHPPLIAPGEAQSRKQLVRHPVKPALRPAALSPAWGTHHCLPLADSCGSPTASTKPSVTFKLVGLSARAVLGAGERQEWVLGHDQAEEPTQLFSVGRFGHIFCETVWSRDRDRQLPSAQSRACVCWGGSRAQGGGGLALRTLTVLLRGGDLAEGVGWALTGPSARSDQELVEGFRLQVLHNKCLLLWVINVMFATF